MHRNGEMLTAPELQTQLQYIRDLCDKSPAVPGIGALTSETRPEWAKVLSCSFETLIILLTCDQQIKIHCKTNSPNLANLLNF